MTTTRIRRYAATPLRRGLFAMLVLTSQATAQERTLPLDSGWTFDEGTTQSVGPFLGRQAMRLRNGVATRSDVSFQDGTIDFDMAVTAHRSFVYIEFRRTGEGEYEEIYVRPHKTNLPDAIQYAPVFRGQSGWQLYHGPGNTAAWPLPRGEWIHVRLVVKGTSAVLYVGDTTRPALVVPKLGRPPAPGTIALRAFTPAQGGAPEGEFVGAYSNVVVRPNVVPATLPAAPARPATAGLVSSWQLSPAFVPPPGRLKALPADLLGNRASWPKYQADEEGRLILDRYLDRPGQNNRAAAVLRTVVASERDTVRRLDLGFSDEYLLFVNGQPVAGGEAAYRFDNPRGDGVIHPGQSVVYLPLRRGDNEVLIALLDVFGGWAIVGAMP